MMDQIIHWVREDSSGLGRPWLPGTPAAESMAVPMMLLNLVEQLGEADEELAGKYAELGDWCAQRILQHVQVCVCEGPDDPLSHSLGDSSAPPTCQQALQTRRGLLGELQPRALGKVWPKAEGREPEPLSREPSLDPCPSPPSSGLQACPDSPHSMFSFPFRRLRPEARIRTWRPEGVNQVGG